MTSTDNSPIHCLFACPYFRFAFPCRLPQTPPVGSLNYQRTIFAYHGCDRAVAESVLLDRSRLDPSRNGYDWLGTGI